VPDPDAAPALRLQLLGGFRVWVGSSVIEEDAWRLRKAASLLKLLALTSSHRLHREQLLDLLWPDLDPKAAANNLHHALHVARRLLTPAGPSPFLRLQAELLSLAPADALWVDAEAFESAAAQARRTADPGTYRAALSRYTGELLPQNLYEDWAADRREGLRGLYLSLLLELAGLFESMGQPGGAIETLQRAVSHEPATEAAHASLMRLFARTGQRHQALRQYEQLQQALEEELDAEPEEATQQLYQQILAGEVPSASAPADGQLVQAAPTRRHNLPAALTSFVGRQEEIAELERLLGRSRLVTLTGAGGSGKTRLALEAAGRLIDRYPDGVWLVELASLSDPALVPQTVADILEVTEQPDQSLLQTLVDTLQSKRLLLLLDNCEHLIGACASLVSTLLRSCPRLHILATSRESLRVEGEVTGLVPPLSLPAVDRLRSVDQLLGCDSIRLLVERAQYRQPSFLLTESNAPSVVEVCRKLEGIPLAIELAAARVGVLSVEQIAARLDDALGLLTGGSRTALSRQQTLRGTLDWSYLLLSEPERALFNRLSIFAGGWTLEAAEVIGGDAGDVLDLLSRLVDRSLVVAEAADGEVRYRFLEPVRQYAYERLTKSGEAEEIHRRHAELFLHLAEQAGPQLQGPQQQTWLERLETEHDNLRAALQWHSPEQGNGEMGLRLAGKLWPFWCARGYLREAERWLGAMLARADDAASADRAEALQGAALVAYWRREYDRAAAYGEQGLELYRAVRNLQGAAACLNTLGLVAMERAELQQAIELHQEALDLSREVGDRYGMAESLGNLGTVTNELGDLNRALTVNEECLTLFREIGDPLMIAAATANVGATVRELGECVRALECFGEALRINQELGDERQAAFCLEGIALTLYRQEKTQPAVQLLGAAEALREACGVPLEAHLTKWYEPYRGALKAALGDEAFGARWLEGHAMPPARAVEYALRAAGEPSLGDAASSVLMDILTRREREIAELVAQGLTNRQIAAQLVVAERTVDTHVGKILRKLALTSRTQVAALVAQQELVL